MKNGKIIVTAVLAALVFSGCVGTNALGVLDESVPEEQRCPLEIRNNLAVILYDNQPVDWAPGFTKDKVSIELPPGAHSFMTRYYVQQSMGPNMTQTVAVTDTVSMEFIPGHSYRIYRQDIWLLFITFTSVKIKDVTPKNKA